MYVGRVQNRLQNKSRTQYYRTYIEWECRMTAEKCRIFQKKVIHWLFKKKTFCSKNNLNKENINTFSRSNGHSSGHPLNGDHNCTPASAFPYDNPDFGFQVVSHRKGNCCGTSSNSKMVVPINSSNGNDKNNKKIIDVFTGTLCLFPSSLQKLFFSLFMPRYR